MSDIFISYKREDQPAARRLADAIEGEGWTVWWDPKLRAGEHFDDVIEAALKDSKCVIVLWSTQSLQSRYVRDEATYALEQNKLVPVAIENVELPFRFRGIQTLRLSSWNGSKDSSEFRKLVDDITAVIGRTANEALRPASIDAEHSENRGALREHVDGHVRKQTSQQIDDGLLRPFWQRISVLSWSRRFLVLTMALVLGTAVLRYATIEEQIRRLPLRVRVMTAQGEEIPLSASRLKILDTAIETLAASLSPDLTNPDRPGNEAWPVAQVVVAAQGLGKIDSEALNAYFSRTSIRNCACWKEFDSAELPPNIPATGWVLSALSALKTRADSTVRILLEEQNHEGWWSIFPVPDNRRYASVYGTSLAILSLNSQVKQGLVTGKDYTATLQAIRRGAIWLLNNREANTVRWTGYPLTNSRSISESLSGLALHALNQVIPEALSNLNRQWLDSLPHEIPRTDTADPAALYDIETRFGLHNDHFVQIRLPWLLMATTDAYRGASTGLRVNALRWLERALTETGISDAEIKPENWWRAELLIALRHFRAATAPKTKSDSSTKAIGVNQ